LILPPSRKKKPLSKKQEKEKEGEDKWLRKNSTPMKRKIQSKKWKVKLKRKKKMYLRKN